MSSKNDAGPLPNSNEWTRTLDFSTIGLLSIGHTGQLRPTLASCIPFARNEGLQ